MNVLFAGGGTGGHVYPALAVIKQLRKEIQNITIGYVGTTRGLESKIIPREPDIEYFPINAAGFERKLSLKMLNSCLTNTKGLWQSLRVIAEFNPQLIVGTGGYVSFAPLLLGTLLRIPTMIHEQNAIPGLVNRILAPLVDRVLTSFPRTALPESAEGVIHSGLPLRASFVNQQRDIDSAATKRALNLDPARPAVLFMGGTHGAASIHDEVLAHYQHLATAGVQVVILAGRDAERVQSLAANGTYDSLQILGHTHDVGRWMQAADLLVCRAGASTLAEMTALGLPAIVVPWSGAAHDHQAANAQVLADVGACQLLNEVQCANGRLVHEITTLLADEERLTSLSQRAFEFGRRDATDRVVEEVRRQLDHGTSREALPLYRYWRRWNERIGMAPPPAGPFRHRFGL